MRKGIKELIQKIATFLGKHFSRQHPDFPYYLLIFLSFIFFIVGTNAFIELTEQLSTSSLKEFDRRVTEFFVSRRSPELTEFFTFITDLGDVYAYIVASTLVGIFFFFKLRNKKFIFQLLGILILSALSNMALKKAIDRARPTIEHLVVIKSLSYPSGHAMSAMAFYGFLIYLVFKIKMHILLRIFLTLLFSFLILSIGISRIYLGVHFPSDVAGGFIAGFLWILFCIVLFNIVDLLRQRKRRRGEEPVEVEENLEE